MGKLVAAALSVGCLLALVAAGSSARPAAPVLVLVRPHDHARLGAGRALTFRARDTDRWARRYPPDVNVTDQPPRDGILAVHTSATGGTFLPLRHSRRGVYVARVQMFTFAGFWLTTPGRYYIQVRQYDPAAPGSFLYSRVATVRVR